MGGGNHFRIFGRDAGNAFGINEGIVANGNNVGLAVPAGMVGLRNGTAASASNDDGTVFNPNCHGVCGGKFVSRALQSEVELAEARANAVGVGMHIHERAVGEIERNKGRIRQLNQDSLVQAAMSAVLSHRKIQAGLPSLVNNQVEGRPLFNEKSGWKLSTGRGLGDDSCSDSELEKKILATEYALTCLDSLERKSSEDQMNPSLSSLLRRLTDILRRAICCQQHSVTEKSFKPKGEQGDSVNPPAAVLPINYFWRRCDSILDDYTEEKSAVASIEAQVSLSRQAYLKLVEEYCTVETNMEKTLDTYQSEILRRQQLRNEVTEAQKKLVDEETKHLELTTLLEENSKQINRGAQRLYDESNQRKLLRMDVLIAEEQVENLAALLRESDGKIEQAKVVEIENQIRAQTEVAEKQEAALQLQQSAYVEVLAEIKKHDTNMADIRTQHDKMAAAEEEIRLSLTPRPEWNSALGVCPWLMEPVENQKTESVGSIDIKQRAKTRKSTGSVDVPVLLRESSTSRGDASVKLLKQRFIISSNNDGSGRPSVPSIPRKPSRRESMSGDNRSRRRSSIGGAARTGDNTITEMAANVTAQHIASEKPQGRKRIASRSSFRACRQSLDGGSLRGRRVSITSSTRHDDGATKMMSTRKAVEKMTDLLEEHQLDGPALLVVMNELTATQAELSDLCKEIAFAQPFLPENVDGTVVDLNRKCSTLTSVPVMAMVTSTLGSVPLLHHTLIADRSQACINTAGHREADDAGSCITENSLEWDPLINIPQQVKRDIWDFGNKITKNGKLNIRLPRKSNKVPAFLRAEQRKVVPRLIQHVELMELIHDVWDFKLNKDDAAIVANATRVEKEDNMTGPSSAQDNISIHSSRDSHVSINPASKSSSGHLVKLIDAARDPTVSAKLINTKHTSLKQQPRGTRSVIKAFTGVSGDNQGGNVNEFKTSCSDALHHILKNRYGLQTMVNKWAHNIVFSLEQLIWNADAELFLLSLRGDIPEGTYLDQQSMLSVLRDFLKQLSIMEVGGDLVELSKDTLLTALKIVFPNKSLEDMDELELAIHEEQPLSVVFVDLLLDELDLDKGAGSFINLVKSQHLAEIKTHIKNVHSMLLAAASMHQSTTECTFMDFCKVIMGADEMLEEFRLQALLIHCFPDHIKSEEDAMIAIKTGRFSGKPVDLMNLHETAPMVNIQTMMDRLLAGCFKPTGNYESRQAMLMGAFLERTTKDMA